MARRNLITALVIIMAVVTMTSCRSKTIDDMEMDDKTFSETVEDLDESSDLDELKKKIKQLEDERDLLKNKESGSTAEVVLITESVDQDLEGTIAQLNEKIEALQSALEAEQAKNEADNTDDSEDDAPKPDSGVKYSKKCSEGIMNEVIKNADCGIKRPGFKPSDPINTNLEKPPVDSPRKILEIYTEINTANCESNIDCSDGQICDTQEKSCRYLTDAEVIQASLSKGPGGVVILARADKGLFYGRYIAGRGLVGSDSLNNVNCQSDPNGIYSPTQDKTFVFCVGLGGQLLMVSGDLVSDDWDNNRNPSILGQQKLAPAVKPAVVVDSQNGNIHVFARNTSGYVVAYSALSLAFKSGALTGQLSWGAGNGTLENPFLAGETVLGGDEPTWGQIAAVSHPRSNKIHVFVNGGSGNYFQRHKLVHYAGYGNNWGVFERHNEVIGSQIFTGSPTAVINPQTHRIEIFGRPYPNRDDTPQKKVAHWSCRLTGSSLINNQCDETPLSTDWGIPTSNANVMVHYSPASENVEFYAWRGYDQGVIRHVLDSDENKFFYDFSPVMIGEGNFASPPAVLFNSSQKKMIIVGKTASTIQVYDKGLLTGPTTPSEVIPVDYHLKGNVSAFFNGLPSLGE